MRRFTTSSKFFGFEHTQQKETNEAGKNKATSSEANEPQKQDPQSQTDLNADTMKLLVDLQRERDDLLKNVKELDDRYKRSLAETENVRSRLQRQIEDAKIFAIQGFCKDLLEIADVLALAKDAVPVGTFEKSNGNDELTKLFKQFFDGVVMTQTNLHKIFHKHGLILIDPVDEKFDPNIHEAVFEIEDKKKQPGTIGVVVKPGYLLHQRPIRPAKVGIVKT